LWADEGFGVRTVEHLHRHWSFPDHVRLMDGGTQGIIWCRTSARPICWWCSMRWITACPPLR
jgi:hypothetical protein